MRLINRSTVLGTTLVALAILNFSVLDQIGVGLVDGVNTTFEDLGAEWIALQITRSGVDPQSVASDLSSLPGVRSTIAYWSTSVATFSAPSSPQPGQVFAIASAGVQWVMTSESFDLATHPFLFVFAEESETKAKFYRDGITWISGGAPVAEQVAISTDYAAEAGLGVGDTLTQVFGASPFAPNGAYRANFTVSGIYQRAFTDPAGNPPEIVVVGPNPGLKSALRGGFGPVSSRNITLVQAALSQILDVSDAVVDWAEARGYNVSTQQFQVGMRFIGGRPGMVAPAGTAVVPDRAPGGTLQAFTPPDMILFANGEVLASALDAADRAGFWFRTLTTSAVVLAVLGIAFVTAAMERKVRRDVGIRQAVGYPLQRIYGHWALVATTMGIAGAAAGITLVFLMSALGLSQALLGIDVGFRSSTGLLLAPLASVAVYALATLPTYARVLRSSPAQNLRALSE